MALKDEEIIRYAMELKGEAPAAWANFVIAMRTASAREAGRLVVAQADSLPKAQGYAFAFHEIAETLRDIDKLFNALQQQSIRKARNTQ